MSRNISPDQHRRLHRKISRIEYKPTPISDLLRSIWRLSDIGLDLAFYAYFSKDIEAAKQVIEIDDVISGNLAQFIMHTSLAYGRSREAAEAHLLAFYYGSSIDAIVDSIKDIVYTLLVGYTPRVSYEEVIPLTDGEIVAKLTIMESTRVEDFVESYPVDILLSVHSGRWILAPQPELTLPKGSVVYVRGYRENVTRMLSELGITLPEKRMEEWLDPVLKAIIELKDYTRLMIDLAHYTLLEPEPGVIDEVEDLEVYVDWRQLDALDKLKEASGRIDPDTFIGLSILFKEFEDIADASNTISHIPSLLREMPEEYKDIFSKVFESIGERVRTLTIHRGESLDKIAAWLRKYGGTVLAVKIGDTWLAYPLAKNPELKPGDKLVITYPVEFDEEVSSLLKTI